MCQLVSFGVWTREAQGTIYYVGPRSPQGKGQFGHTQIGLWLIFSTLFTRGSSDVAYGYQLTVATYLFSMK